MAGDTVFWVDCELCGVWVHTYCAFQKKYHFTKIFMQGMFILIFFIKIHDCFYQCITIIIVLGHCILQFFLPLLSSSYYRHSKL